MLSRIEAKWRLSSCQKNDLKCSVLVARSDVVTTTDCNVQVQADCNRMQYRK